MRHVRCLYCHALMLGVPSLPDDSHVLVLYAHKACHSERSRVWIQTLFGSAFVKP